MLAVFFTLSAACAVTPPPRLAPGSVRAARFTASGPARFRNLATGTVPRDTKSVGIATNADELAELWEALGFESAPPAVDFNAELVVAFTNGRVFCNFGQVQGFVLTTARELIPEVHQEQLVCALLAYDCPRFVVYMAALSRAYFPPGDYVLRRGAEHKDAFSIGGESNVKKPRSWSAPQRPPAGAPDVAAPNHPRRARSFTEGGGEEIGIWVREDAAWFPSLPSELGPLLENPALLCDAERCVRVVGLGYCMAPECPADGTLVLGEQPLVVHGTLPREAAAWNALMRELVQDPALATLLGSAPRFPEPKPRVSAPVGFAQAPYQAVVFELAASADGARFSRDGAGFGGGGLRLGLRRNSAISDTTTSGIVREVLVGDNWGLDLRLRALGELGNASSSRTLVVGGVGLAAGNVIGNSTSKGRLRLPSLLELLVPELGLMSQSGASVRFYMEHALPASFLLSARFALELRPAFSVRFLPESAGGPDTQFSLSVGFMGRAARSRCP